MRGYGEDADSLRPNTAPRDGPICREPGRQKLRPQAPRCTVTAATCAQGCCAPHNARLGIMDCMDAHLGRSTQIRPGPGALVWATLGRIPGPTPPCPGAGLGERVWSPPPPGSHCRVDPKMSRFWPPCPSHPPPAPPSACSTLLFRCRPHPARCANWRPR